MSENYQLVEQNSNVICSECGNKMNVRMISKYIDKNTKAVSTKVYYECPNCGKLTSARM